MAEETCRKGDVKRLEEFLSKERVEKGLLFYHGDADGVCSAALLMRFFRGFRYSPRKGPAMGEDFVRMILEKKPGLLVFLDMAADQEKDSLERFLREIPGLRIVIIDHHISESDMNSERVLHVNPRFIRKDVYMPAACVVYRLMEGLEKDVRALIWIAAMGVIGDYGWEGCPELIEECREEYPFLLEREPPVSRLARGAEMVAAATTLKGLAGVGECLKALMGSEGFEDFEPVRKLNEWKREFDDELRDLISDFEKNRQVFDDKLITYEVKSGLNITSVLSTCLGGRFPDKVLAIRKADGKRWKISLRGQSGEVNLGEIAKECSRGIGSGGGHEKAAAVMVSDWEEFLKRMRKALGGEKSS